MDTIFIKGIHVHARHGCLPEEQTLGQRFIIHLQMQLDLSQAGTSDQLEHSVNYAEAYALVCETATTQRFDLIEALAEAICTRLLSTFAALSSVCVTVEKPSAPVPGVFDTLGVTLRRTRASLPG